ncbi:vitamin K epoxide reductase family protein [Flavobacterium sp.]|uniref:vitamin K epoxide reductase family protein n=1 Tax=Flavobacterium sp. TaxID=239 RepID=UPI0037C14827
MKESIENLVNKYIQLSNYKVEKNAVDLHLLTHPDYPSVKSISDTYDYFGIENIVANVPFEAISQLPENFISLINGKLHLVKKDKNYVYLIDFKLQKTKIPLDKLKEIWNGIIIAIETNGKMENNNKIKKEYLFFSILLLISIIPAIANFNLISIVFTILTFIGFLISYFIVKETFGMNNKIINKFCDTVSKNQGCSNVINDTKSKLFNEVSLSDSCIVYFSSLLLFSVFVEFNVSLLFLISIFSLPVIFYSIYYQAFVIRDWCALCVGISVILLTHFFILFNNFNYFIFDLSIISKAIFIVIVTSIIWYIIKNIQISNLSLESTKIDFIKFKRNKNLFNELLSKKQLISNDIVLDDERIFFGSNNPKLVFIAVTNPLCGYCAESFQTYYEILNKYEDVQINFVFSLFTNDPNNPAYKILNSILEIYHRKSKKDAIEALKKWFDSKDLDNWIKKYGATEVKNDINKMLEKHRQWSLNNNISQTPTTILNEYFYPEDYNIKDIFYFIDDMLLENKN